MSISNEFETFAESLPLEEIKKIMSLPLEEEDLKLATAYVICRKLEGINICFPKKAHKNEFAHLLLKAGVEPLNVAKHLQIHIRTIKRIIQKGTDYEYR